VLNKVPLTSGFAKSAGVHGSVAQESGLLNTASHADTASPGVSPPTEKVKKTPLLFLKRTDPADGTTEPVAIIFTGLVVILGLPFSPLCPDEFEALAARIIALPANTINDRLKVIFILISFG